MIGFLKCYIDPELKNNSHISNSSELFIKIVVLFHSVPTLKGIYGSCKNPRKARSIFKRA